MLSVLTDKLGVYMYKSYEDVIYVSTTLIVHGPCTHGSHLAGMEYIREERIAVPFYGLFVCLFVWGLKLHWLAVPIVRSKNSEDPTCDGLLMPEANCTSSYRATYILIQDLSFQREIRGSYTG
jgi:hypothetical protein